jgi:superfamily II DNA/RNA helicase
MPSTGPDLTDTTTASRETTDAEPHVATRIVADNIVPEAIVAETGDGATETSAPEAHRPEEPVGAEPDAGPAPASAACDDPDPSAGQAPSEPPNAGDSHQVDDSPQSGAGRDEDASQDTGDSPADPGDGQDEAGDQPSLIPIVAGAPPEPPRVVFSDLGLSEEVLRAIDDMGYRHPTPIQEQAIPYVLMGRDVMGTAQTGTGKTAGFTLPMLDILSGSRARARMPRSLILEPTRELALQVAENFVQYGKYLKLTHALIIGGESMSDQKDVLNRGVDVLIATPGRLLDMFDRGSILLSDTRLLVIDEADRMLDMGFIPDVERIVSLLPATRQTLFFSATMGPEIRRLVDAFLTNPKEIAVSRAASVATTITEGLALVAEHDKREALRRLIRSQNVQNALIFCNRKRDVDILHKSLSKHNFDAGALHGDLAQTVRFATLEKFKANELRLLVCSDVAARGIDIGGLSHVFNFDVPIHAEDYVHRIGRTGRAGSSGHAISLVSADEQGLLKDIERLLRRSIPVVATPEFEISAEPRQPATASRHDSSGQRSGERRDSRPHSANRHSGGRHSQGSRQRDAGRQSRGTRSFR